ncbi:gamma-glutamyltransferase [Pseudonocardia acaciae]|uniref:gamma-glutamyltransferase n=1 Tax=Pseudonocardia acaciae TaxID=551276 RepID=UPI0005629B6A|nr:gamma-glutamyltransferase [Pseudonocardia acaciae]
MVQRGVVAAGHPATAAAGAAALRSGGNAVDAAVASVLTSFVAEPLHTGLGAGGHLLVVPPGQRPVLLDFFVEAPGRGAAARPAPMEQVVLSFEGALQTFNVGASSCGTFGAPAGVAAAATLFGRAPLAELTAPAARLAREGVRVNAMQAYVFALLAGVISSSAEAAERYLIDGRPPREGEVLRDPELADALDRLGSEGAAPFYTGDIGDAVSAWVRARGGTLTREDLAAYRVVPRTPLCVSYRGRQVFTNPPPSAGGGRLVRALTHLATGDGPPREPEVAAALDAADREARGRVASAASTDLLGSTTHISVLDADGWACSVTCSNGTGSGVRVPGTGVHLNNMLGEHDVVPRGLGSHVLGDRLPSSMAPTVVCHDDVAELVVGSAGSSRIRSALLQVVVNVVDRGASAQDAVDAPRLHLERGLAYAEPGIDVAALERAGHAVRPFVGPHLFFGGCQAVRRYTRTGAMEGGADGRRGGAVVVV